LRVLVLGGYGLIGLEVVRQLHAAGHRVTGLARAAATGRRLFPRARWVAADIGRLDEARHWREFLQDTDVVVNASGVLQSGARDDPRAVQETAIVALIRACESAGVARFVQISAPGARPDSATEFMRSKARADARLKRSGIAWTILRPGLVVGRGAYGGTALIRMLAGFPLVQPLLLGERKLRTVALTEVAEAVCRAAAGRLPARTDADLVEPEERAMRQLVRDFRAWLGVPPPRLTLTLPVWLGFAIARIGDGLGYLGWRPPLRTTAMRILDEGLQGDPKPWRALNGGGFSPLERTLAAMPATVQERWFARLWLAMPLMVGTLAAFWLLSGGIALARLEQSAAIFAGSALPHALALPAVVAGAALDLLLGAAILFRRKARGACLGMVVVTLCYLAAGTMLRPELWADPLGPLVKTIPAMVLALVTALVLEER